VSPGSVSFDRAVEYYDRTRANPDRVQQRLTGVLAGELLPRGPALEIGVGTGRIALPLHEAGVRLVGADLSRPMMDRMVGKAGGRPPFPLVQADATRLPFADQSFGSAYAAHVLHLVPAWRDALRELVRVVRPGGAVLIDQGLGRTRQWWDGIQARFMEEVGVERRFVGVDDPVEIDAAMEALGASSRLLPRVRGWASMPPEEAIQGLEQGLFSWTWDLTEDELRRAGAATRAWARERHGRLELPRRRGWTIQWRVYDLPGRSSG
jgi:ubiquinone/menaquinone biosynthesis C-methylase UbiE